jgi:hypothetical protein
MWDLAHKNMINSLFLKSYSYNTVVLESLSSMG